MANEGGTQERHWFEQAKGRGKHSPPTWVEVDAEKLRDAVDCVVQTGDAITLGATMDGGALMMNVLSGGQKQKPAYLPTLDGVHELLDAILDTYHVPETPDAKKGK
jgi:hypothetical protein